MTKLSFDKRYEDLLSLLRTNKHNFETLNYNHRMTVKRRSKINVTKKQKIRRSRKCVSYLDTRIRDELISKEENAEITLHHNH